MADDHSAVGKWFVVGVSGSYMICEASVTAPIATLDIDPSLEWVVKAIVERHNNAIERVRQRNEQPE